MTVQTLPFAPQEGVHLYLPDSVYFEAPAIGSSDLATLYADPATWWYQSANNPMRRARLQRANHLNFGTALHTLLLEGEAAFDERFTVEPDSDDSRWLMSVADVKRALKDKGVDTRGVFEAPRIYALARKHGIAHLVYALAWSKFEASKREGGKNLNGDEERRLRHMVELIQSHEDLGAALKQGISEVAVFYRDPRYPDVLLRAKFDKLLPDFAIDLKSISNYRGGNPDDATFKSIIDNAYDLQAEHYRETREQMRRFIREGKVFSWHHPDGVRKLGAKSEAQATLDAVAANDVWRWVWIFYQVRNDNVGQERAPVIVPWFLDVDDQLFARARATIDVAMSNYVAYRDKFGLDKSWSEIRPIRKLPTERLKPLDWKREST